MLNIESNEKKDDSLSMVRRLRYPGIEEGLAIYLSSSLSLVTDSRLRALLDEVGPLHVVESDAIELLCTLSLTLGTKSVPSIPGGRRERSRLGGDWEAGAEAEEVGVVEG